MGKVRFGLSNVHYAPLDVESGSYGEVKAIPGAVTLTAEYEGDTSNFYADNIVYEPFNTSSSLSGTLTVASAENDFLVDTLGYIDDDGLLLEDMNAQPNPIALLFEVDGNLRKQRCVYYNVKLSRPSIEHNTTEDTTEPSTISFDFTAIGRDLPVKGETHNIAKATIENDPAHKDKYDSFMDAVLLPTATAGE